jgi:hypothetical protein
VTLPPEEVSAVALMEGQLSTLSHLLQGLPDGASCCQAPG